MTPVPATNPCPNCGRVNAPDMRFCGNCGTRLAPPEPAEARETPAPNAVAAATEASAPRVVPGAPPVVAPAPLIASTSTLVPPEDPILRTRERERLLTLANVQRLRGQHAEARKTLTDALAYGLEPREVAPTYELLGDLYANEMKFEEAMASYKTAFSADPQRVSAERKFATMTLRASDAKAMQSLTGTMLASGDVRGLMGTDSGGPRRNPGIAFILSACIPGAGQFYNGQQIKGFILVLITAICVVLLNTVVNMSAVSADIKLLLGGQRVRGASQALSPLPWSLLLLSMGTWLYAVIDAVTVAAKGGAPDRGRPKIDKTGWEV